MDIEQIKQTLKKELTQSRYLHTKGVAKTAIKLANRYGVDPEKAKIAALLHDCAKCYNLEKLKTLAQELNLYNSNEQTLQYQQFPVILHAHVGAKLAFSVYGVQDNDIINSIKYHTTARENMSTLEKVIYISDYIEPNRKEFPDLEKMRKLAKIDLDITMIFCLKSSLTYLSSKNIKIHPYSKACLESLIKVL